jgi:hypothetical protein
MFNRFCESAAGKSFQLSNMIFIKAVFTRRHFAKVKKNDSGRKWMRKIWQGYLVLQKTSCL